MNRFTDRLLHHGLMHVDGDPVRWCLIYELIRVAQLGLGNADQRPQSSIHRLFIREILGNIR